MILKKLYMELILIRKELQAIRLGLEHSTYDSDQVIEELTIGLKNEVEKFIH